MNFFTSRRAAAHAVEEPTVDHSGNEKSNDPETVVQQRGEDGTETDEVSLDAQKGVQKIEATTKVWTRRDLIIAYIL